MAGVAPSHPALPYEQSTTPADPREVAMLAFFTAIREMESGDQPVDVDHLLSLAEFVLDAHAQTRESR